MTRAASSPAGIWCCELELSSDAEPQALFPKAADQTRTRALVRYHGEPLGYVTVEDSDDLRGAATRELAPQLAAHQAADAASGCPNTVHSHATVTVVVCTRNRSDILVACLDHLKALTYAPLEIVVVDNAPSDDSTQRLVESVAAMDPRFRYVREPQPGLSAARNRGLAEATGDYLAYTDDDVAVDPDWIEGLVRGFQTREDVGCVTGLVCTAAITSRAEAYFDARAASWSTRCEPELFDIHSGQSRGDVLYPYSAGIFGTGANFAFETAFLRSLGGFDEALGAGTRTKGGEDLDVFVRVLRGGRAIAYEPAAIVWHHHRADDASLLTQMFGYGTGLSAYLTKCLVDRGTRKDVLSRIPVGLRRIAHIKKETGDRLEAGLEPPRGALRAEMTGYLAGPYLYARARRSRRKSVR